MIKFISLDQTLVLRSQYLRAGLDPNLCHFDGDENDGSFHIGYFEDEQLKSVATFHRQGRAEFNGLGYQLRGMITVVESQGKGLGTKLLNFAIVYLRGKNTNYIWCNARKVAYHFYQGVGFEFISSEFQIDGIGPHRVMYLKVS